MDLFELLEKDLRDRTFDYEVHDIFFRHYLTIGNLEKQLQKQNRQREIYKKQAFALQESVEQLEKQNHDLHLELEDARAKVVDYANEVRAMANTTSWKIVSKIRRIIHILNFGNGLSLLDRFCPLGTRRREKIDKKRAEKKEILRVQNIRNATDEETAEYWLVLEKIWKKRREQIENAILQSDSDPYEFWGKLNDCSLADIKEQQEASKHFTIKPKISIIIPLYNTPTKFFRELLFTVYYQTYTNWELCLADGSPERLTEIESMCAKDKRIKYTFIGENKGISGNSNEALKLATGDYIALLDHDDLLPLNALYEVVNCINVHPEVRFIYTDEDKIEAIDKPRYDPHFKPDYSPDFLLGGNYICHFSIFKKELMDQLEGFRSDYDGAQDFDIILRATELAKANEIYHIPKVLYHWRIHPGSTAGNSEAKLYAYEAGAKAVQHHLDRMGIKAIAKRHKEYYGIYTVNYSVKNHPKVNIVIVNTDDIIHLQECIKTILEKTTYDNFEIDVIDNATDNKETLTFYKQLEKHANIKVWHYADQTFSNNTITVQDMINGQVSETEIANCDFEKANYSQLMNFAVKHVDGQFIVELDRHERVVTPEWLESMIGIAQREDVGCVGVKVNYPNGTIKHAGIVYGIGEFAEYLYRGNYNGYRAKDKFVSNMSCISSLCRMYRKEVFEEVQGMSEEIHFEKINEVDFSLKLREKGYLNVYTPYVQMNDRDISDERETIEDEDIFAYKREVQAFKKKWHSVLAKPDPYYNINFSPISNNCLIRIDKAIYEI